MEDDRQIPRDPLKPIPPSRHPFQFLTMFALGLSGAFVVFGKDSTPGSVDSLLSPWIAHVWGFTMFFGGVLAIASSFWPDRITGLLIERIALAAVGGTCLVYAAALLLAFTGDLSIAINVSIFCAAATASAWRIWHINGELKRLSEWVTWTEE